MKLLDSYELKLLNEAYETGDFNMSCILEELKATRQQVHILRTAIQPFAKIGEIVRNNVNSRPTHLFVYSQYQRLIFTETIHAADAYLITKSED